MELRLVDHCAHGVPPQAAVKHLVQPLLQQVEAELPLLLAAIPTGMQLGDIQATAPVQELSQAAVRALQWQLSMLGGAVVAAGDALLPMQGRLQRVLDASLACGSKDVRAAAAGVLAGALYGSTVVAGDLVDTRAWCVVVVSVVGLYRCCRTLCGHPCKNTKPREIENTLEASKIMYWQCSLSIPACIHMVTTLRSSSTICLPAHCVSYNRDIDIGGIRVERWWDKRMHGWQGPGPFVWRQPSAACTAWASALVERYAMQPLIHLRAMKREVLATPGSARECARAYLWVAYCTLREVEGGIGPWKGWQETDSGVCWVLGHLWV